MAKKRFKLDLNNGVAGIKQLQDELRQYQDSLDYKARLLSERLSEMGVDIACVHIASMDAVFNGELMDSMRSQMKSATKHKYTFVVKTDSDHAAFVEFGTGWVGDASPYPYKFPDGVSWEYIVGGQILANAQKGVYGWVYLGDDGNFYFTEGMPARPFMYETSLELEKKVVRIAKEVFR